MPIIPIAMALAQFAPSLMKIFGSSEPTVAAATKVVEIAQIVTGTASPEAALQSIQVSPEKQMEFALKTADNEKEIELAYLRDTQDARNRDIELAKAGFRNDRANILAGSALLLVVGCLFIVVLMSDADDFAKATISLILGRALGWVEQLFSFEFGTTRSSGAKDETIKNLTQK